MPHRYGSGNSTWSFGHREWKRTSFTGAGGPFFLNISPCTYMHCQVSRDIFTRKRELELLKSHIKHLEERVREVKRRLDEIPSRRISAAPPFHPLKVQINTAKCTGCGVCIESCSLGAIKMNDRANIDASLCTGCGACVSECPQGAISLRTIARDL